MSLLGVSQENPAPPASINRASTPGRDLAPTETQTPGLDRPRRRFSIALRPFAEVFAFDPRPLAPPRVVEDLDEFGLLGRAGEVIRYNLACLEHAISPGGQFRAYVWLNLRVLLYCVIPITGILVILSLLTPIAGQLALIFAALEAMAHSTLLAVLYLIGAALALTLGISAVRALAAGRR